ncbi:Na+/H+ antiporter subunit G [Paracoccus sp. p4-l81]|uniref:Na+/H+ antiporter subunit G n=1 Tax=unclassified Paracoccus (in: a-proteobacteria) TaxID=2688777 RepID=UPI0035B8BD3A
MQLIAEILISAMLVIAGVFGLVGSLGLVKLPDPMTRLHAPTKATTLGVGGALIASMLYFWTQKGIFTFHELLITLFLFLTAPITGHFIAKSHLHWNWRQRDLSRAAGNVDWATYGDSAAEADRPTGATATGKLPEGRGHGDTAPAVPTILRAPD